MAAQGRRLGPLIDRWLLDPGFHTPLPRWHPRGVRPDVPRRGPATAVASGWSVRDLLCTATHFIAETVALALRKTLPEDAPLDELIVPAAASTTACCSARLPTPRKSPLLRIDETSLSSESLDPACVALWPCSISTACRPTPRR